MVLVLVTGRNVLLVFRTAVTVRGGCRKEGRAERCSFLELQMDTITSTALQAGDERARMSASGAGAVKGNSSIAS